MITIETITMKQIADVHSRAVAVGMRSLADAACRAQVCDGRVASLRRCVDAINGVGHEGKRLWHKEGRTAP